MNYAREIHNVRVTESARYWQQNFGDNRRTRTKQRRINRLNRYYRRSQRGD